MTLRLSALVTALLCLVAKPTAGHPAHAEELEHPYVAGFERFYSDQDSPDHLAQGGRLLLNELNCVGCHQPPATLREEFPGAPGPNLEGVASRIGDPAVLQLLIRNPRFLKRGTRMPSQFGASDRNPDELEALYHYLLSLNDTRSQDATPAGDPPRGQELFHRAGCVACHAPGQDYVPASLPDGVLPERPGMPSAPIRLATFWSHDFLSLYLQDPATHHPDTRMPDFRLGAQEAADLAAYLQMLETEESPGLPEPDPALQEQGKALFASKGCVACHQPGQRGDSSFATPLLLLPDLANGCLSETPQPNGLPHYFLSPTQREALVLGIRSLGNHPAPLGEPLERLLTRHDCYACHTYRGRGGPELAREPYFGAADPRAPDRLEFLPPALDDISNRRSRDQLLEILTGPSLDRRYPKVQSRMLRLPDAEAETIADQFHP